METITYSGTTELEKVWENYTELNPWTPAKVVHLNPFLTFKCSIICFQKGEMHACCIPLSGCAIDSLRYNFELGHHNTV